MSLIFPLVTLLGQNIAKFSDKINFNKHKHDPKQHVLMVFSVLLLLLLVYIKFDIQIPEVSFFVWSFLFLMVVISSFHNFLQFEGVELKPLSYREPLVNMIPIVTAFLAFLIFPSEREVKYLVAIILGVVVLYWNLEKTHEITFDKGTIVIFLEILCAAVISNLINYLLTIDLSPEFIFLIRSTGIFLVFLPFLFFMKRTKEALPLATFSGIIYFVAIMSRMYSMKFIGLNATVLLLLLGPVITYLGSYFILKEKITKKEITTSFSLLTIIVVTFLI